VNEYTNSADEGGSARDADERRFSRIALVTGASRGLGATVARVLARRGFNLVLGARGSADLEAVAAELRGLGTTVQTCAGDIAEEDTRRHLIRAATESGGLDLLVNNASELGGLSPLTDVGTDRLDRIFRVNVLAPFDLARLAIPLLRKRRGLIVNVSSDAAQGAYPGWGVYGASKAALDLLGRTLAAELQEASIAVVNVDPGDLRTRMHQEAFPTDDISDRPLPEVTVPFWEWLLDQDPRSITGERFRAQEGEQWAARV
jgi:NAD(P)-dependent dehydrogenase (short-subunit alcohol dehydrogenase family)